MNYILEKSKFKLYIMKLSIIVILCFLICSFEVKAFEETSDSKEEVTKALEQIFEIRNRAILTQDVEMIESIYDLDTKYGTWAMEYEIKKLKYLHNWAEKQGVKFTEINPTLVIRSIKGNNNKYSVNLLCSTEYKYVYENQENEINSSRIGTYHTINLLNKDGVFIITKEWYTDPFADSLNLENIKADDIKQYILSQEKGIFLH